MSKKHRSSGDKFVSLRGRASGATGMKRAPDLAVIPASFRKQEPIRIHDLEVYTWHSFPCGHEGLGGSSDREECAKNPVVAEACCPGQVKYYAMAFVGERGSPEWRYRFGSLASRDKAILAEIKKQKSIRVAKAERKAKRAEPVDVKVGEIFYSSWGYDQTNIDYYVVQRTTKSTADIVKIGKTFVRGAHSRTVDVVMPDTSHVVGKTMKKRIQSYEGRPYFTLTSYSSAYRWDGKPKEQTAAGYGHAGGRSRRWRG